MFFEPLPGATFRVGASSGGSNSGSFGDPGLGDTVRLLAIGSSAAVVTYIKIGASPTAGASDMPLATGVPEYMQLRPGTGLKIAAKTSAGTASLYVSPGYGRNGA